MSTATLTSKGQTTIPRDIRDALGLKPKDRIHYTLMPDGTVIMRAKTRSIVELKGVLHDPERKPLTIEQMQAWRR